MNLAEAISLAESCTCSAGPAGSCLCRVKSHLKLGWAPPIFLLSAWNMCVSNTAQNWNARMRWGRCKRPIQSFGTYSPANKIPSSALPSPDLSDSCHFPWKVTCKVLIHLLSLKSLTLDLPLSTDPTAPAFPVKNLLLSDSSYNSLVACCLPKLNLSASFTISS